MDTAGLVIVGASYAGLQVADAARAKGYQGRICLVGEEAFAPYQRPPLSKGLLNGKQTSESLIIRSPAYFEEQRIELLLQTRVESINREAKTVQFQDGSYRAYDWLVLATGARCRQVELPDAPRTGVYTLRDLNDGLAIHAMAETARRVCVIGAGFIGLEVAGALSQRGLQVDVLVAGDRVLRRSVPAAVSNYFEYLHTTRGVHLHYGAAVTTMESNSQGAVQAVVLNDGRRFDCDAVVVGIGVDANDELAAQAGLHCDEGIVVDACGRTADPFIFAAGDCARFPNPYGSDPEVPLRLESIQASNDLARAVASVIAGEPTPYNAVPWFWSDQYESKLQIAGLSAAGDEVVLRGDPACGKFSLFLLRHGRIVCVHSISKPAEHLLARKLIEARVMATSEQLADEQFSLKQLLTSG